MDLMIGCEVQESEELKAVPISSWCLEDLLGLSQEDDLGGERGVTRCLKD